MSISKYLEERGLLHDISDRDLVDNLTTDASFYVGIDPTASYLQIGNLFTILVSAHLARFGLKPIFLFGGATGAIGDPSGKNKERNLLSEEVIRANIASQSEKVREIFTRLDLSPSFVNNYEWTEALSTISFLRDVGKYFTINYMLAKDSVKSRLEAGGISYTEFTYMILQGFDFLHLYQKYGCRLQIGGSDQWGNITAGLELIRKKLGVDDAAALSWPLITDSAGRKFGKSEAGTLWLDDRGTSYYRFHQFFLNVDDADAIRYLKILTLLPLDEIAKVELEMRNAPEKRVAQNLLADEVCNLVHGQLATTTAKACAAVLFGGPIEGISLDTLKQLFEDLPSVTRERAKILGRAVLDVAADSQLVTSKGEAKRLLEQGGLYLNNHRISESSHLVTEDDILGGEFLLMRAGKKKYLVIKLAS